ncbi:hypothetical protein [Glaciibacter superstes]|uniref:hypothetical protein n=1 Tax=Glaciibacter superstes TaxID=501023 RepID=UPI0003B61246|nr:hypothetical protein [Glaciibacter superstes]
MADNSLGIRGPVLGLDLNADVLFHFSPWDTYMDAGEKGTFSTNILVMGSYRGGKSGTMKQLAFRSLAYGHQSIVPSDSKGEWVVVAEAVGGQIIALGGSNSAHRLTPLDRGPRASGSTDEADELMVRERRQETLKSIVRASLEDGERLRATDTAALLWALSSAIATSDDRPIIRDVLNALVNPDVNSPGYRPEFSEDKAMLIATLDRFVNGDLGQLFDGQSTVVFDENAPMVVVDTSQLWSRGELAASLAAICTNSWIQAVISDRQARRTRYLIREEGWRDMASESSLKMYRHWLKLSRHYGVANIIILHTLADFDVVGPAGSTARALATSIAGDIENRFIFRQNDGEFSRLITELHIPESHARLTRSLQPGVFLAQIGKGSYVVDAFVTSTDLERELFDTDEAVAIGMAASPAHPEDDLVIDDFFTDLELDRLWPSSPEHESHLEE